MQQGDKWCRLTCVKIVEDRTPIMADDGSGGEYDTGDFDVVHQYHIACECGKQVVVDAKDFQGKRKMRDCGCGCGLEDTMSVGLTITMPMTLRRKVQAFADQRDMKISPSITRLIERGLATWVDGSDQDKNDIWR